MSLKPSFERGAGATLAIAFVFVVAAIVALLFYGTELRRFAREFFMQRVTSAHYEILCPAGALSQDAMTEFATHREPLFASLDKKLDDAGSNLEIRVIFDSNFPASSADEGMQQPYAVASTTIRTKLTGRTPQLPPAADAESLLYATWGKPGNAQVARWTANWLVGEWRSMEIGMAAAQVEQRLGHKKVEIVLANPANEIASPSDETLLGAAWISEIAEFGGASAVRKLYAAKMRQPNITEAASALGTTPLELERKWQLWMYAYLAGMPSMPQGSAMPMGMPMGK